MTDDAKTATATMMLNLKENRLQRRDHALASSIACKMVEQHFDPEHIESASDMRRQMTDAALFAAYEAIQQERRLHAEDMEVLKQFSKLRLELAQSTSIPDCTPITQSREAPNETP